MYFGTSKTLKESFLPFALAVLIGTAAGSILEALYPDWGLWQNAIFRQGMGITGSGFAGMTGCAFLGLAVMAILGLSVLGMAGVYITLLLRGMALGAVLAEMYAQNGFAGILTAILFVMPYAFGGVLVLLLAARETCRCTGWIIACLTNREAESFSGGMYAVRFLVLAVLMLMLTGMQYVLLRFGYPVFLNLMLNT